MAEGEGTDAIDAAIQSAESLLGSLLRPPPASPLNKQPPLQSGTEETEVRNSSPESSLQIYHRIT